MLDTVETAHSTTLELVNVCKGLPDFITIQTGAALNREGCVVLRLSEQHRQALRVQARGMTDLVVNRLKEPGTRCQEGGGRKKAMVRVIELRPDHPRPTWACEGRGIRGAGLVKRTYRMFNGTCTPTPRLVSRFPQV